MIQEALKYTTTLGGAPQNSLTALLLITAFAFTVSYLLVSKNHKINIVVYWVSILPAFLVFIGINAVSVDLLNRASGDLPFWLLVAILFVLDGFIIKLLSIIIRGFFYEKAFYIEDIFSAFKMSFYFFAISIFCFFCVGLIASMR